MFAFVEALVHLELRFDEHFGELVLCTLHLPKNRTLVVFHLRNRIVQVRLRAAEALVITLRQGSHAAVEVFELLLYFAQNLRDQIKAVEYYRRNIIPIFIFQIMRQITDLEQCLRILIRFQVVQDISSLRDRFCFSVDFGHFYLGVYRICYFAPLGHLRYYFTVTLLI